MKLINNWESLGIVTHNYSYFILIFSFQIIRIIGNDEENSHVGYR